MVIDATLKDRDLVSPFSDEESLAHLYSTELYALSDCLVTFGPLQGQEYVVI
jgi:hypothetical protein